MNEYQIRNELLRGMGFDTYRAYLESPLWKVIRTRQLELNPWCSLRCGKLARIVHHSRYTADNLTGASVAHLHPLCHACHKAIEHGSRGRKLTMPAVRRKFEALLVKRRKAAAKRVTRRSSS